MTNSISRRNFLKGSVATAAVASLAACGGSDGSDAADGSKKKIVRWGQGNPKLGLDMQKSTNSGSSNVSDPIFESLLRWTEENELVPCLLAQMPVFEEDGVTLHCTLKENVKFHDGTTLTANDVKYTFERMFLPATAAKSTYMYDRIKGAAEMLAGFTTELEGLTVEDDTHFTFVLTDPMASFISNLGLNYAQIFPKAACEAAGEKWGWGTDCVGTGKYKIVSNDDTTEVTYEKFADYHDGEPALDEVRVTYFDDNNTKLMAFKNGDIDWCELSPDLLAQYKADPDVKDMITSFETLGVHFINLNLNSENLKDVRVREALSLAIDRQAIVDNTLSGAGIAAGCWLAPQTPGHDDSAVLEYNPEKARQLLKEAGVTNLTLDCKVRKGQYEKYMTVVQSYWAEVGVTMNLTVEDNGVWQSDWAGGNLEITGIGWFPLYADGDNHIYTYFYSANAAKKSSFYNNPEVDDLLTRARVSQDADERAELYKQADHIITHEDYAAIPLYWPKSSFVSKPYVKGAKCGNLIYHFFDVDIDTSDPDYATV